MSRSGRDGLTTNSPIILSVTNVLAMHEIAVASSPLSRLRRFVQVGFLASFLGGFVWLLGPFWQPIGGPTGFTDQRLIELALILVATVAATQFLVVSPMGVSLPSRSWGGAPALVLLSLLIASSLQAEYPSRALQELGLFAGLIMMTLVLGAAFAALRPGRADDVLLISITAIASLYAVGLVFNFLYVLQYPGAAGQVWVVMPNFPNPRLFNDLQPVFVPLLFAAVIHAKERRLPILRICAQIALQVWLVALYYSLGRGVSLSLLVGLFLVAGITSMGRLLIRPVVVNAACAYVIYWLVFDWLGSFWGLATYDYAARLSEQHTGRRIELWTAAIQQVPERFWLGSGLQHYIVFNRLYGSPHNSLIHGFFEIGVPATLIVVYFVLRFLRSITVRTRKSGTRLDAILLWSLLSSIVYSLFAGNWLSPLGQLSLVMLVAFILSRNRMVAPGLDACSGTPLLYLMPFALGCIGVSVLDVFVFHDEIVRGDGPSIEYWAPRFWLNGRFHEY